MTRMFGFLPVWEMVAETIWLWDWIAAWAGLESQQELVVGALNEVMLLAGERDGLAAQA